MERLVVFNSSTHTPLSWPPAIFLPSNINTLEVCKFNISMVNNYFILKISCWWKIKYFKTFEHILYFRSQNFVLWKKNKKLTRYYGIMLIVSQSSPINMKKWNERLFKCIHLGWSICARGDLNQRFLNYEKVERQNISHSSSM